VTLEENLYFRFGSVNLGLKVIGTTDEISSTPDFSTELTEPLDKENKDYFSYVSMKLAWLSVVPI